MKVRTLQENLRKALWKRIDAGEITGLKLADLTGFKQAHISNFLNRKRSLSIEGSNPCRSTCWYRRPRCVSRATYGAPPGNGS